MVSVEKPRGLFTYLATLAVALAAPPIVLANIATVHFAKSEKARLESVVDQANADVARLVETTLSGAAAMLHALATSPHLQQGDYQAFDEQARKLSKLQSVTIMLSDTSNRQIVNTLLPWGAALPKQVDMEFQNLPVSGSRPYVSNLFKGAVSGKSILRISVPVSIPGGEIGYFLSATIQPSDLSKILKESLARGPYFATILDRNGIIAARSVADETFVGRPLPSLTASAVAGNHGTWSGVNPQGVPIFVYWRRSELSGWLMATGISQEALRAPLNRSLSILALITVTLILIAGAVAFWIGGRMTRAHARLVQMARELGAGRVLEPAVTPLAEANVVARAIATASANLHDQAQAIQASREELESRIEERTGELALKQDLLTTTLESMDQGLVAVDERARVTVCNRRARELLGLPAEAVSQQIEWTEIARRLRPAASDGAAAGPGANAGPTRFGSFESRQPNGVVLEVAVSPVGHGGAIYALTDVTLARRHEEELKVAKEGAERASQAKTDLLATMSHEIRTPLNSVMGSADLLASDVSLGASQQRLVTRVLTAGTALTTMMEDILDFAKVEAGSFKIRSRRFALEALIEDVKSISSTMFATKDLTFAIQVDRALPRFYSGDDDRLRQVLLNYINNAVKFTFAGSVSLTVSGQIMESGNWALRFAVADTGIGIPPEKQALLFQRFTQADETIGRRFGGAGLGLSICKRLIESMDGEVGVESTLGRGTVLWFYVPLPEADEADAAPQAPAVAADLPRLRILVAEDVPVNQDVARELLERLGQDVTIVASGAEAVDLVQKQAFDLILMDIFMSGMDGLDATRAIRAIDHPARGLPILACTANVLPAQVAEFRHAGLDGFVAKPLRRLELEAVVLRFARTSQPDDAADRADAAARSADAPYNASKLIALLGPAKARSAIDMLRADLTALASASAADAVKRADLARRAHRLISTTSLFGLSGLSGKLCALEVACRSQEDCVHRLAEIRPDIALAIGNIDQIETQMPTAATSVSNAKDRRAAS